MSTESPLWLLAISVKLQAVALLSLCMAVRITACALSAAFYACRLVTSVWRFQVRLKMLLEEALALTFFYLNMKKQAVVNEGLLIWQEHQSGNLVVIMTQTICIHPPVHLATYLEILPTEQIPMIREGLSRRYAKQTSFCGFFNDFSSF